MMDNHAEAVLFLCGIGMLLICPVVVGDSFPTKGTGQVGFISSIFDSCKTSE